jgi:AraC family transcriptional regulator, regulatory protein of adaptative response / DNA-3-methyladenine glycosylase II
VLAAGPGTKRFPDRRPAGQAARVRKPRARAPRGSTFQTVVLDPVVCYNALRSRDERFDGRIFVGVTTTGIYCRPVCPARPAKPENCRFFASATAAQAAGFRPCLRCRPETAPDVGSWRGTSNTVSRGLALVAEGALDDEETSVDILAERLGVGARQLRRVFRQHLGASPIAVAQTRRVLFAKQLIHDTRLPMTEVALAAGFGSVRRFNEVFLRMYGRPPSALRRGPKPSLAEGSMATSGVTVKLRYRPPYDWPLMMAYLKARAVDGVESVDGDSYLRTLELDGAVGTIRVSHLPEVASLAVTIRASSVRALPAIVARIRRLFDLGSDVAAIGAHLAKDPILAPLIARRPGLRVPGTWDGFELAVRAILGQQVSVEAGRRLAGKLVSVSGPRLRATADESGLTMIFPTAAQLLATDPVGLGVPRARRQALTAVARAAHEDPLLFQPRSTLEETVARLQAIRGVGEWTAHYIALRAAREPDAFPATDAALIRAAARVDPRLTAAKLKDRAERWRPWRAYAAQHLWAADAVSPSLSSDAPSVSLESARW